MASITQRSPQEQMIQAQVVDRGVRDERVIEAMRQVPRDKFFPEERREGAFEDNAAPIGYGQTISQPYIVALMTQALELGGKERVLEIGTGSGYHTAILSRLADGIWTVERIKPLLDAAFERLMDLGCRNVHYRHGDGTLGWVEAGSFDRIVIAAGAPAVPRKLIMEQLVDGGIAVVPAGPTDHQTLYAVRRKGEELVETDLGACRFVPLIGSEGWPDEGKGER